MSYNVELTFFENLLQRSRIPYQMWQRGTVPNRRFDLGFRHQFGFKNHYVPFYREYLQPARHHTVYTLRDEFLCYYLFLLLPDDDRLLLIGPYLSEEISDEQILEQAERIDLPPQQLRALETYYHSLPVLHEAHTVFSAVDVLCDVLWPNGFQTINLHGIIENVTPHESVTSPEDTLQNMEILEQRYQYENAMMQAVAQGSGHRVEQFLAALAPSAMEKRTVDPVRNIKNYGIIMNTLLRKAAENGGVHPIYLDRQSNKFARQIEQLDSVAAAQLLMRDMFRDYCRLVRTSASAQYSPAVQKALACIDADLSGELNLRTLAEQQNLSAGYLSALFHREVGLTITQYITDKRLELAERLLKTTQLQIQTVAQYCGIPDVNYFTKLFKKRLGKTPREYRNA